VMINTSTNNIKTKQLNLILTHSTKQKTTTNDRSWLGKVKKCGRVTHVPFWRRRAGKESQTIWSVVKTVGHF